MRAEGQARVRKAKGRAGGQGRRGGKGRRKKWRASMANQARRRASDGVLNTAQITAALMSGAVVATRDWEAVIKTKKLPHAKLYGARLL